MVCRDFNKCGKEEILISIVLPVYNCEYFLKACIKSILCQTYRLFELIIVDDGSTDSSGVICDGFINDNRVRVYHQKNMGLSCARSIGCEKAKGQLILFVDSDDYLSDMCLSTFINLYNETNADIIVADFLRTLKHDYYIAESDEIRYYYISNSEAIKKLLLNHYQQLKNLGIDTQKYSKIFVKYTT